jgi:hypothetical protein
MAGMPSFPSRIERSLWSVAFLTAVAAVGVWAWKREPVFRDAAEGAMRRVGAIAGDTCEAVTSPPESGPVRLPTCRTTERAARTENDPWLAPGAHGPDLAALGQLSADVEHRRWQWEDVNTVPVREWQGDVRVVEPGAVGRRYAVRGDIDATRAQAMERAFGYELDRAVIRYHDDSELARKRTSLDSVLALHGVRRQRTPQGDVLAPDYEWMVEASLDEVRPIARAILAEARKRGARGMREEFGALASFVQQLKYGDTPDPGDSKHRFGLSMPLWALATETGDCDTRAVLLIALARSVGLCDVYLVRDADHQHMLAAAALPVRAGDKVLRPEGRTLVLVETTDAWPVGRVPERTQGERLETLFIEANQGPVRAAGAANGGGPGRASARNTAQVTAPRTEQRPRR